MKDKQPRFKVSIPKIQSKDSPYMKFINHIHKFSGEISNPKIFSTKTIYSYFSPQTATETWTKEDRNYIQNAFSSKKIFPWTDVLQKWTLLHSNKIAWHLAEEKVEHKHTISKISAEGRQYKLHRLSNWYKIIRYELNVDRWSGGTLYNYIPPARSWT